MSIFVSVWDEGSIRAMGEEENSRPRRMLEPRGQANRVFRSSAGSMRWLKKSVLAGQNVIEAQGVTAALHSRELKRSTYSHLWNYSSLQIKAKKHVVTQTAQASAWPWRNICWSEEKEAEDIQTWGRSPERESEIIYQSARCDWRHRQRRDLLLFDFFVSSGRLNLSAFRSM